MQDWRLLPRVGFAAGVAYTVFLISLTATAPCGVIGLMSPGQAFVLPDRSGLDQRCIPTPYGYDGQFYWGIALDPAGYLDEPLADERPVILDLPSTRMQRILLPVLAAPFGGGDPIRTALSLAVLEIVAMVGVAVVAGAIFTVLGQSPWLGLWISLYPGFAVSVGRLLTEPLAILSLLGGLLLAYQGRFKLAALVFLFAVLSRETAVLGVVSIACSLWWTRRPAMSLLEFIWLIGPALLAFVSWHFYLANLTGEAPIAQSASVNLGKAGQGLIEAIASLTPPNDIADIFFLTYLICTLMLLAILGVANVAEIVRNGARSISSTLSIAFFAYLAIALIYSSNHFDNSSNLVRSLAECTLLGMMGAAAWITRHGSLKVMLPTATFAAWGVLAAVEIYQASNRAGLAQLH
jgi:hypothetical protein